MQTQHQLKTYMIKNGLLELPEPVWISDFFMNSIEGNIIRNLKPLLVFPVLNMDSRTLTFFKVGKKGEKLKKIISPYSNSNGYSYSQFCIYDSEDEAFTSYLDKMNTFILEYEDNIKLHKSNLKQLKKNFNSFLF